MKKIAIGGDPDSGAPERAVVGHPSPVMPFRFKLPGVEPAKPPAAIEIKGEFASGGRPEPKTRRICEQEKAHNNGR